MTDMQHFISNIITISTAILRNMWAVLCTKNMQKQYVVIEKKSIRYLNKRH